MREENRMKLVLWGIFVILGGYLILKGVSFNRETFVSIGMNIQERAVEAYLPSVLQSKDKESSLAVRFLNDLFVKGEADVRTTIEKAEADKETDQEIIRENEQFLVENLTKENQEAGLKEENQESTNENQVKEENKEESKEENKEEQKEEQTEMITANAPAVDLPLEQFQDFNFVISNFYTIDKTTSINREQLDAVSLLEKDLRMNTGAENPQILIYHSHSQEEFADSNPGDSSTTIVGIGEYLTTLLRDTYGYHVLHVTDTFDIVDGKLDRNKAYNYAQETISRVLEENPSIEVVIDLHRDGVTGGKRLVTEINGKPTAKIMFFNGLSRTNQNGELSYLPNPYIQDNLAFSLQLARYAKEYYPDWFRTIYLRGYRYNLHLRPKALLVECGAQTNTVEEEMNAMEPLADILNKVLRGE